MKQITEADKVHEQWFEQARDMTPEELPEFMRHLAEDYGHDYGTICQALAASAVASCWAMNKTEQGGITGFQASAVMWEFVRHWMSYEGSIRMVKFDNMLYPQYDEYFDKVIDEDTWKDLQEKAKKLLNEGHNAYAAPNVKEHWQSILNGEVPFGYTVKKDEE